MTPASGPVQVDRYSAIYPVSTGIDFLDPAKPFGGWFVHLGRPGAWVRYDAVDFGEVSPSYVTFRYRSSAKAKVTALLSDEESLGTFDLPAAKSWKEVRLPVKGTATGSRDLKLRVDLGCVEIDWVSFE